MNQFFVTPEARENLFEIWDYIARDSVDAADRVISEMNEAFAKLADMPGIGHFRDELLDSNYRFWSVRSYLIAYRWEAAPLEIVAIVHGARDLESYFERRPLE